MYQSVLQGALALPREQKEELVAELKVAIFGEMAAAGAEPARCPRCGHAHVVSKGRGRDGSRRWLCRGCGRTFSAKTDGVLALSKLGAGAWTSFLEGMVEGLPLRRLAQGCGVCLKTAWHVRMRACSVMESRLAPFRCDEGTSVQVDEKYPNESLSGNRDRARARMPREPHANGHGVTTKGLSGLKACVPAGVNDLGDCFCRLVGRGKAGKDEVRAGIAGVPLAGAVVSTDGLDPCVAPLAEAGALAHNRYNSKVAGEDELGMVNALHSRLGKFLAPFNGVSTRRLPLYLSWFCWEEQARRSDATRLGMLASQVANGTTGLRIRAMWEEPQPFFEYWGGRVWSEEVDLDDLYEPEFVSALV